MSGTSIDSVDYALCSITEERIGLQRCWRGEFPRLLQRRLQQAARGICSSYELAQLHHDLGRLYAQQAQRGLQKARVDLVGLHGQTIFHQPSKAQPATLQIGEPAYLVEQLRVPVVSNFRAADLAAGGQGAPLATLFHQVVFGERGLHVCVNNLGGISNVTSIDWRRGSRASIVAFDTGPANLLMDLAVQHFTGGKQRFDEDGRWARRGVAAESLLARWLKHPYFLSKPPKSTGRERFGEIFLDEAMQEMARRGLSKFDVLATLTEFTARSLALNYRLHLDSMPQRLVLAGGGAANPCLVERIGLQLQQLGSAVALQTSDQCGWPVQTIEPAAFALLAYYRFKRKPGNIPTTTGADRAASLGQVSEP